MTDVKRTPLNSLHCELGARMVEFAGWEMPVQYESALKEHLAVRDSVGLFDVSHMGEIEVLGKEAVSFTQKITSNDVSRLSDGQAQYSAFLYPQGTFIDDIIVYRISAQHIFICVNAANKDKDFKWVSDQPKGEVEVRDSSDSYAQIAVQGPKAQSVLQELTKVDLSSLKYYWFTHGEIEGAAALISRTGYTGEAGFEIYVPPAGAEPIWRSLLKAGRPFGIACAGLAARNTLRLEVRYPLYGNDIDQTTTPWEAGLGWIVKLDQGEFVGREALQRQKETGIERKLVGFELVDRGIARDHHPVYLDGQQVGEVRSGSYSPSLEKSIGLVYLPTEKASVGRLFEVEVRGKRLKARVVETPFYRRKDEQ
ncbi:MAG: glycine cleavage system aminomethyltransferase GcvT [Acidobacteriota bacterium]